MAEALLRMAERVARLSAWRVELPDFVSTWSDGVRAIHELPEGFVPILETVIDAYVPEDRSVLRSAVAECANSGEPFAPHGSIRWRRCARTAQMGAGGPVA